jgi:hypothetical protein
MGVKATPKQDNEGQVAAHAEHDAQKQHVAPIEFSTRFAANDGQGKNGHDQPHVRQADAGQAAQQHTKGEVATQDVDDGAPHKSTHFFAIGRFNDQRGEANDSAKDRQQHAQQQGEIPGSHARARADGILGCTPCKRGADHQKHEA